MVGASVCRAHGGASPQVQAKAGRERAEAELAERVKRELDLRVASVGLDPVGDPLELLGVLAAESRLFMIIMGEEVNKLNDQLHTTNHVTGEQQIRAVVALYERAIDRTIRVVKHLVDAGFEERKIRLDENTAAALVGAIGRALGRTITDETQRATVAAEIVTEVRALEATR